MYKLIKQGEGYNDSVHYYICDTFEDLQLISVSKNIFDSIGDKAYIINTSEKYVRNSEGLWVEDLSVAGGIDGDMVIQANILINSFDSTNI